MAGEFPIAPLVQAAPDGLWEQAVVVDGDPELVFEPMSHGAKHIGVEVMWPGHAFVGAGCLAENWQQAADAVARVRAALDTRWRNTAEAGLRALLDREPSDDAHFAQLGAVNAWSSVGAENLWRTGEPYSPQAVDAILDRRPDLALTCAHPVAVEFGLAHEGVRSGWIAFYVAPPGGPVDRARLHEILARVTAATAGSGMLS